MACLQKEYRWTRDLSYVGYDNRNDNLYNKKSQTVSKLYRRYGFDEMVKKYGLIDPAKYIYQHQLVKAWEEVCR